MLFRQPQRQGGRDGFYRTLCVDVDDFWQNFGDMYHQQQIADGHRHRRRAAARSASEIMTMLIAFQSGNSHTFKYFYRHLLRHHSCDFPRLVSNQRGVQLITHLRSNIKNMLMDSFGKLLLRKRSLIETINDQLKNVWQIDVDARRLAWTRHIPQIGGDWQTRLHV